MKVEERRKKNAENLQKAKDFHQSKLICKTFINGWKKLIEQKSLNNYLASKFRNQALITTWFEKLKKAYAITRTEREIHEKETVQNFREYMLKRKSLVSFKNFVLEESLILQEHRKKSQLKLIFRSWYKIVPKLREENDQWEERIQAVIDRFRLKIIGPKILRHWKDYVGDQQKEKEKKKFQKNIWNKVNGWLDELDEKHQQIE